MSPMLNIPLGQSGGADWVELVAAAIGVIIVIGGGIAGKLKEMATKRRERERQLRGQSSPSPLEGADGEGELSLQDLAARRRAQLRAGGGGGAAAGGRPAGEPQNMTMAERIERARARAAYEQRARELREATARPGEGSQADNELQRRIEARREQRDAQARARAEQEAERLRRLRQRNESARPAGNRPPIDRPQDAIASRRAKIAQERERQRREQLARQQAEQRQAAEQARRRQQALARQKQEEQDRRRQERAAQDAEPARGVAADAAVALGGRATGPVLARLLRQPTTLRQAIVLKELLDRPVGFREPGGRELF